MSGAAAAERPARARRAPDVVGPPGVWLGDAARAVAHLGASGATVGDIVALLGLVERPDLTPPPSPPPDEGPDEARPARVSTTARDVAVVDAVPAADRAAEPEGPPTEIVEEEPTPKGPPRVLPPLAAVLPLPPPEPPGEREPASLLAPARVRTVLTTLASSPEAVGPLDVERVVAALAGRRPLRVLPLHEVPSTRRGLQLLVDFGPGMRGFVRDRDEVWATLARVAGADGLEVLRFAGTPLDDPGAGPGGKRTWQPYRPAVPGRPVLVLSDLGSRAPAAERAGVVRRWVEFADLVRGRGSPTVALVPLPVGRVAPELRRAIGVVPWDRSTGIRHAAAAARRAARA